MVVMLKVIIIILDYDEKKSSRIHQIILKQFCKDFNFMKVNDEYFTFCEVVYMSLRVGFKGFIFVNTNYSPVHHLGGFLILCFGYIFIVYEKNNRVLS